MDALVEAQSKLVLNSREDVAAPAHRLVAAHAPAARREAKRGVSVFIPASPES
jgi:hypothetical protein